MSVGGRGCIKGSRHCQIQLQTAFLKKIEYRYKVGQKRTEEKQKTLMLFTVLMSFSAHEK